MYFLRCMVAWWCMGGIASIGMGAALAQPVQPPQRIVSLQPSLTEAVCALGECARLVGVDRYSSWPQHYIATLPVLGGGIDPNIEAVVALQPDLVLLSKSARVTERLQALGLNTLVLDAQNQAQVQQVLQTLAQVLGKPQAAPALWQRIQAAIDAAADSVPEEARGARVYFEVSRGPYAAGSSSYIGEILTRLGASNVVPPALGPFPQVSPEFVLRAAPEVIMQGEASQQTYPGWTQLQAVREQRVCRFNQEEINILLRPGPRMDEAAQLIARCLREKAPRRAP